MQLTERNRPLTPASQASNPPLGLDGSTENLIRYLVLISNGSLMLLEAALSRWDHTDVEE